MKSIVILVCIFLAAYAGEYYYEYGKKIEVQKLYDTRAVSNTKIHYYITSRGDKLGVNNEIIVQCKKNIECVLELKKYNLNEVVKLSQRLFLVRVPEGKNIFELSRELYEQDEIEFAHPNFTKTQDKR